MIKLIGDIGATNARFASVVEGRISSAETLACADFETLTAAACFYVAKHKIIPRAAAIAVAAPVMGDEIRMVNHAWVISQKEFQADLRLENSFFLNDFDAVARAIPHLAENDCYKIGNALPKPRAPVGIIGPGTGLGVAALVFDGTGNPIVVPTEGGHMTMHAHTPRQFAIIEHLKKTKYSHVSVERLVSGKGILNLYQAICALDGKAAPKNDPAEITDAALKGSCPTCVEVLDLFCFLLGSVAGNYALSLGAFGGIYIAGGIVPKLGGWFKTSSFYEGFVSKGRYKDYLSAIPVFVITHDYPAFLGLQFTEAKDARP